VKSKTIGGRSLNGTVEAMVTDLLSCIVDKDGTITWIKARMT